MFGESVGSQAAFRQISSAVAFSQHSIAKCSSSSRLLEWGHASPSYASDRHFSTSNIGRGLAEDGNDETSYTGEGGDGQSGRFLFLGWAYLIV